MKDVNQTEVSSAAPPSLKRLLRDYRPLPEEQSAWSLMVETLSQAPRCFERDCFPAHFTGSIWALNAARDSVVLVHHRALDRWLQPGGHADGEPDLFAVALRELWEETGLLGTSVIEGVFDLDAHEIPPRGEVPRHLHLDVRFAVVVENPQSLRCSAESHQVAWVALSEVEGRTRERSVLRMVEKTVPLQRVPTE